MKTLVHRAYRLVRYPNRKARIVRALLERRAQANENLLIEEMAAFAPVVKSHPICLYVDTTTVCNLRCPFCPTGNGEAELGQGYMTPDVFYRIMGHLEVDLLRHVYLFNWGEPLLNKHLTEYVRYFSARGVNTTISTNLSAKTYDDAFMDDLVSSGLGEVQVSIDGATPESYGKYRIGGDFERVLRNMKTMSAAKRRLGSETPTIYYKMLLNKFNESELDLARQYADECGAEFLLHEHFWVPEDLRDEWVADAFKEKYGDTHVSSVSMRRGDSIHTECRQLWDSVLVCPNGDVLPCCIVFRSSQKVGNLLEQDISEIRNNAMMQELRTYVTDPTAAPPGFANHCQKCGSRYCTHDLPVEAGIT